MFYRRFYHYIFHDRFHHSKHKLIQHFTEDNSIGMPYLIIMRFFFLTLPVYNTRVFFKIREFYRESTIDSIVCSELIVVILRVRSRLCRDCGKV